MQVSNPWYSDIGEETKRVWIDLNVQNTKYMTNQVETQQHFKIEYHNAMDQVKNTNAWNNARERKSEV